MTETWKNRFLLRLQWAASAVSYGLVSYRHPTRAHVLKAVRESYGRTAAATTPLECGEIYQAVAACDTIPGDMAEAGVYLGGTARLMLVASRSGKRLHLFDTFEGLPYTESQFAQGEWACSIGIVQENLKEFEGRLDFHPGFFPDSAEGLEHLRFSFVHLDLDLYQSTRDALEWFWPRLNPGGILVSHDYPFSEGVVRAFSEFFATRQEPVLPLSGNQCVVVKA